MCAQSLIQLTTQLKQLSEQNHAENKESDQCIIQNHKQNNKDSNDDSALQHDEKAWHALITTDENSSEQVYWNHAHTSAQSDLHCMKKKK